jgi:hypothetical protein
VEAALGQYSADDQENEINGFGAIDRWMRCAYPPSHSEVKSDLSIFFSAQIRKPFR